MYNPNEERKHSFLREVIKPIESRNSMRNGHQYNEQQQSYSKYVGNKIQNSRPQYPDEMKYLQHMAYNLNQEGDGSSYCYQHQQQAGRGGGGGDYRDIPTVSKQNYFHDQCVQHKISQTEFKGKKSDETFAQDYSDRSDSTKQTTIIKQATNGKNLLDLVRSKASLHQDIDDTMTNGNNHQYQYSGGTRTIRKPAKSLNSKLRCLESDEDLLQCSTSQSAELINEKIIHPMVKKFRLLYLHNIKEEVAIMEDLEKLPNKLAKFCQEMENNS